MVVAITMELLCEVTSVGPWTLMAGMLWTPERNLSDSNDSCWLMRLYESLRLARRRLNPSERGSWVPLDRSFSSLCLPDRLAM